MIDHLIAMKINHWDGLVNNFLISIMSEYVELLRCLTGKQNTFFMHVLCSVIRELATKALHNLTPQAPDYMATTGTMSPYLFPSHVELVSLKVNCLRKSIW